MARDGCTPWLPVGRYCHYCAPLYRTRMRTLNCWYQGHRKACQVLHTMHRQRGLDLHRSTRHLRVMMPKHRHRRHHEHRHRPLEWRRPCFLPVPGYHHRRLLMRCRRRRRHCHRRRRRRLAMMTFRLQWCTYGYCTSQGRMPKQHGHAQNQHFQHHLHVGRCL